MKVFALSPATYATTDKMEDHVPEIFDRESLVIISHYMPHGTVYGFDMNAEETYDWLKEFSDSVEALGE